MPNLIYSPNDYSDTFKILNQTILFGNTTKPIDQLLDNRTFLDGWYAIDNNFEICENEEDTGLGYVYIVDNKVIDVRTQGKFLLLERIQLSDIECTLTTEESILVSDKTTKNKLYGTSFLKDLYEIHYIFTKLTNDSVATLHYNYDYRTYSLANNSISVHDSIFDNTSLDLLGFCSSNTCDLIIHKYIISHYQCPIVE